MAISYEAGLGDFAEDKTVYMMFNTFTSDNPSASCTITNFTSGDVHIHKDDGLTQRNNAAGITVSIDFDGITGSHMIKIDTSDDTVAGFWVVGHDYFVRIEGTTIDGATINSVVGHFSIENRFMRGTDSAALAADTDAIYDILVKVETTVSTSNHASSFTIADGVASYNAYRGMTMSITDADDGHSEVRRIKSYSSGRVVVLDRALGFTPAVGDIVEIMSGFADVNLLAVKDSDSTASNFEDDYNGTGHDKANSTIGTCTVNTDMLTVEQIADQVWDEILSGVTHNIAGSAGRRVREIGAFAIESGTAQAGTISTITLAATANGTDGLFNRNLIVLTDNTGKGQTRTIVDYNATSKVVVIDRDWRVTPDATTAYQIVPDDTPLTVDHGVVQAATATTITIRDYASSTDGAYLCNIVAILAGTGRGQARLVGSYDGANRIATICGDDWVTTPDTTSVYAMMPYGVACAACVGTDACDAIADCVLDELTAEHTTAGSLSKEISDIKTKTDNLPSGMAKNVAVPKFDVFMVLSSDHVTAATGKTVTGTISKDGGSFVALTNAITEVSGGMYTIASGLTQAERNADVSTLVFTASGCDDRVITIISS